MLCFIANLSIPVQVIGLRNCNRALDVVFLIDCGPDISDAHWNLVRTLSWDIAANYLHPSTYGTHVALVQFGGNASVIYGLSPVLIIKDRPEILQAGRNFSEGIRTVRRLVLNNKGGDRPEVPDVIVLITRGLSDDRNDAVIEASRVKSDGIRIITVGIARAMLDEIREQLRGIATDSDDVGSLMLITDKHRGFVRDNLVEAICSNIAKAADGSLRLLDGTLHTGRLEICISEEWATVCSNSWTAFNTRVACRKLGFSAGLSMYTTNRTSYHRRIGIANTQCSGNENSLLQCLHDPFFHTDSSCSHQQDVFLHCLCNQCNDYTQTANVRLANRTPISGLLEVFSLVRRWGAVCSTGCNRFHATRDNCDKINHF